MPANPIAYLLAKHRRSSMVDATNCFVELLPVPSELDFELQGDTYRLKDQHLTIYKNHNKKGPIHYTANFLPDLKMHVYFNEGGSYISCEVFSLKNPLSEEDEKHILKFAKTHAGDSISRLLKDLEDEQKSVAVVKDAKLSELTRASRISTTDSDYRTLLQETLQVLSEYERLVFEFDEYHSGAKKFLTNYWKYLQTPTIKAKVTRGLPKLKAEKTVIEPEENKSHAALPVVTIPKTPGVSVKTTDGLSATLKERERELDKQFRECSSQDVNQALSILQKMDSVKKMAEQFLLFQLCIDGNVAAFKKHFSGATLNTMPGLQLAKLLSTCVYHNHQKLFNYLYHQIKNTYIKHRIFHSALSSLKPVTYFESCHSMLDLAYKRKNLVFYRILLTEYSYDPNKINPFHSALLETITEGETDYTLALLEAGIDPNKLITDANVIHFSVKEEAKGCLELLPQDLTAIPREEVKHERAETQSRLAGSKPLHLAVTMNNWVVVEALLEHKADSYATTDLGITPFGCALLDGVDEKIISLFLTKRDHKIDEKHSANPATALLNACLKNQLKLVKTLLKFGADPCVAHENLLCESGARVPYQSPLSHALLMGYLPILNELLKCPIKLTDLKFIYEYCIKKQVAIPDIYFQKYAEEAHKAGELELAEWLYQELIFITDNIELKHVALFELATCVDELGKQHEAMGLLSVCIEIREKLARDPIKNERMQPLIEAAKSKLALIKVPEQALEVDRIHATSYSSGR